MSTTQSDTSPTQADSKITVTAQLPVPLVETLRKIAAAEGRSLASQIRIFLADSVTRNNTADMQQAA